MLHYPMVALEMRFAALVEFCSRRGVDELSGLINNEPHGVTLLATGHGYYVHTTWRVRDGCMVSEASLDSNCLFLPSLGRKFRPREMRPAPIFTPSTVNT
jgi:hypothetical protein